MSFKVGDVFKHSGRVFTITGVFTRSYPMSNIVYAQDKSGGHWSFLEKDNVFTPMQKYKERSRGRIY